MYLWGWDPLGPIFLSVVVVGVMRCTNNLTLDAKPRLRAWDIQILFLDFFVDLFC